MSDPSTKTLGFSPKPYADETSMAVALRARACLGEIINHHTPGLPLKAALPSAAARLGFNVRRVRALWNREARSVLADEMAALERELARIAERELTSGIMKYANRLETHAARLAIENPDLHRERILRLRRRADLVRNILADDGEA